MKRIEPNLLLAIASAIPMALLVMTATLFGEPGHGIKYALLAVLCTAAFVALNSVMSRKTGRVRPALIHPGAASTAIWASIFPAILMLFALVPFVFPGHDYGLLIIVCAVIFGGTIESAIKARKQG